MPTQNPQNHIITGQSTRNEMRKLYVVTYNWIKFHFLSTNFSYIKFVMMKFNYFLKIFKSHAALVAKILNLFDVFKLKKYVKFYEILQYSLSMYFHCKCILTPFLIPLRTFRQSSNCKVQISFRFTLQLSKNLI